MILGLLHYRYITVTLPLQAMILALLRFVSCGSGAPANHNHSEDGRWRVQPPQTAMVLLHMQTLSAVELKV